MAIVFTPTDRAQIYTGAGIKHYIRGTVAFDSSFAAGGEAIKLSQIGVSTLSMMTIENFGSASAGYVATVDLTNSLVQVYKSAGSAAAFVAASGVDLSVVGAAVPFQAIGY